VHVVPTAMPPGGNVVDVDQRNELAWVNVAVATLRTGLTEFGPGGTLRFANPRFGELFGLAPPHPPAGARLSTLLDQMATREEFAESEGARCIAAQREADRSCPSVARRIRADGQVIGIVSDPLPDGGWALTVTDISALARAEDDASGQAALMRSILEAIPHASAFTARIVG
jgi:PAS domain-containing protein